MFQLAPIWLVVWLDRKGFERSALALTGAMFLAAAYCVYAGFMLAGNWHIPEMEVEVHRRSSAVALFVIKFWPYVLIGSGAYFGYQHARIIRDSL